MSFRYMFIDESGNLGFSKESGRYFIISALIFKDLKQADRFIKNMRRNKFKKELKTATELKANNSSDKLRHYILQKINELDFVQIFHIILDKEEVKSQFLRNDKHKLYNFVAGKLAKNILINNIDIEIIIDKSKGKQFLINDFDRYFKQKLSEKSSNYTCKISHSYSHNYSGLQLVDFLAWSVYRKYEYKDSTFNNNIEIEQEIFSVWY
ncbi:MAG: DUF3800 domain-containing protein [Nanoarchaeota archaeon]|nr:DUF3800 domain-containing protein [Nanoarchaeota archaeon]